MSAWSQHHQSSAGVRDHLGSYLSRPPELASRYDLQVLFTKFLATQQDLSVNSAIKLLPIKGLMDAPFSRHDGGGIPSLADWSSQPSGLNDTFKTTRTQVFQSLLWSGDCRLPQSAFHNNQSTAPFPERMVKACRDLLNRFLLDHQTMPNRTIAPDQPMHLYSLESLMRSWWIQTSISANISLQVFVQDFKMIFQSPMATDPVDTSRLQLRVHQTHWRSLEGNIDIARECVRTEFDSG